MTNAILFVLAASFGLLITGVLSYRLSANTLGKLWSVLAVTGLLLFAWGRFQGGLDGLYAIALLMVFVLPLFIGTLIAGIVKAWTERRPVPDAAAEAAPVADLAGAQDDVPSITGDRGLDLLIRRARG